MREDPSFCMEDRSRFVTMFRGDIILNIALVPAYRSALYSIIGNRRQRRIRDWRETEDKSEDDTNLTEYVEDAGRLGCGHYLLQG